MGCPQPSCLPELSQACSAVGTMSLKWALPLGKSSDPGKGPSSSTSAFRSSSLEKHSLPSSSSSTFFTPYLPEHQANRGTYSQTPIGLSLSLDPLSGPPLWFSHGKAQSCISHILVQITTLGLFSFATMAGPPSLAQTFARFPRNHSGHTLWPSLATWCWVSPTSREWWGRTSVLDSSLVNYHVTKLDGTRFRAWGVLGQPHKTELLTQMNSLSCRLYWLPLCNLTQCRKLSTICHSTRAVAWIRKKKKKKELSVFRVNQRIDSFI